VSTDEAAWFASLPTLYGAAAALFTDEDGRVLLVKPNYRDHWSLPGGILEHGEPPHVGCAREVAEEIGLDIVPGNLLTIGWVGPEDPRPRPIVHFIFDGGTIAASTPITVQASELDDYRFVSPADLAEYLPEFITARVTAALNARASATEHTYTPRALSSRHVAGNERCGRGPPGSRRGPYLRTWL
jgi:8-oxo-dGTP diphosphatase